MLTRDFLLSGDAVLTVEVPATFRRAQALIGNEYHPSYTYRVSRREFDGGRRVFYFVHAMTGPGRFAYLGVLEPTTGRVRLTDKSAFPESATRVLVARRVLARVAADQAAAVTAAGWALKAEAAPTEPTTAV